MSQFRKFISILALSLLPVFASAGDGDFVEIEIHSFPSQGGIIKSLPHVGCIYCTRTQELSVSIAAEGYGRGPVANVKIIELTGSGEVFSTQERVPMSCFLRLPHSGVYQILISLSSGQCFMGMLTVGDNLHDSPFRKMFDDGAGWL